MSPSFVIGTGVVFALLAPIFCFRHSNKSRIIYISVLTLGLILVVEISILWIVETDMTNSIFLQAISMLINIILLTLCIFLAQKGILYRIFRNVVLLQKHMKAMLLITVWIGALIVAMLSFLMTMYSDMPGFTFLGMLVAILIILVGVMCPLLILNSLSKAHFKKLTDTMGEQIQAQVTHYETMVKVNDDIRRFQHDYMNLHLGLERFLKHDDIAGALDYLKSEEMTLVESPYTYETGSVILDVLLSEKQLIADTVKTSIVFDGILPESLLSTADICIVFGNALDNAIEACAKCTTIENKLIKIKSNYDGNLLFIDIYNPTSSDVAIVRNTIATTKEDKLSHGIGLRSIRTVAEKYSGEIKLSCKNHVFCIEIGFNFNAR